jgi:hypothetical protein
MPLRAAAAQDANATCGFLRHMQAIDQCWEGSPASKHQRTGRLYACSGGGTSDSSSDVGFSNTIGLPVD